MITYIQVEEICKRIKKEGELYRKETKYLTQKEKQFLSGEEYALDRLLCLLKENMDKGFIIKGDKKQ